jgi:predicted RNase H-like HicB family nuclease
MNYPIVIEKAAGNYSAYVPDLPGCVAVGDTVQELIEQIEAAIAFHLETMIEDGDPIPAPSAYLVGASA